jgi:myo-inositol-1(or 4)-monophosphatase
MRNPHSERPSVSSLVADARDLANQIRAAVEPLMGTFGARAQVGTAVGGDATMEIDRVAESVARQFVLEKGTYRLYTEDIGLLDTKGARAILIVDPIDGTRPAAAGFESCCVSVAATTVLEDPTLDDVEAACVLEIKSGTVFSADSRGTIEIERDGKTVPPSPTRQVDLASMFWAGGYRGRPYMPVSAAVSRLADLCAIGGSTFDLGSASYIMTRIITGQLDAYVDPALRVLATYPDLETDFLRAGRGSIVCNAPYDIAAAYLCLRNAGGVVSDAWGEPLGSKKLLGSDRDSQLSVVAASNPDLHKAILRELDLAISCMQELIPCIVAYTEALEEGASLREN